VSWLDPASFAIVDVFVMDFAHHTVFDYAPGSAHPESAGTVTIVHRGRSRYPDRLWAAGTPASAIRW